MGNEIHKCRADEIGGIIYVAVFDGFNKQTKVPAVGTAGYEYAAVFDGCNQNLNYYTEITNKTVVFTSLSCSELVR